MSWRPSVSFKGTSWGQPTHLSSDSRRNKKQKVFFLHCDQMTRSACFYNDLCFLLTCLSFTLECHNRQTLRCICQNKITICLNCLEKNQKCTSLIAIQHLRKYTWIKIVLTVLIFCLTGQRLTGVGSKTWHVVSRNSSSKWYVSAWSGYKKTF